MYNLLAVNGPPLVPSLIYFLIILASGLVARRLRWSAGARIVIITSLLIGLVSGVLTILVWWTDSEFSVYINAIVVIIADMLSLYLANYLGGGSPDPSYTPIELIVTTPYIYLPTSIIFWLFVGYIVNMVWRPTASITDKHANKEL